MEAQIHSLNKFYQLVLEEETASNHPNEKFTELFQKFKDLILKKNSKQEHLIAQNLSYLTELNSASQRASNLYQDLETLQHKYNGTRTYITIMLIF
jgi:hypothetical protein